MVALAIVITATEYGASIPRQDAAQQEKVFQQCWGTEFNWKFEELPEKGSVRRHQMPYSGYIYPDNGGGTTRILRKYDSAFNRGRRSATSFEAWDTKAYKGKVKVRGPIFGMVWGSRTGVPEWSGHCNGWAAASIRHAEPQRSVNRNGVVFTPADIKGLLAEIYIYNEVEDLSGTGTVVNAGLLHTVVTNWVGRGRHAIAMESDPSEEKWNYPIYAFNTDSARRSSRSVEVKMNLGYLKDTDSGEFQESPKILRMKYFHYMLTLNSNGEIIGGRFYPDSAVIDMLWVPMQPKQGRQPGNEAGNPYLSVREVLAIWRDSVPDDLRQKWVVVDPTREDRELVVDDEELMIPAGYAVRRVEATIAEADQPADSQQSGSGDTTIVATEELTEDSESAPVADGDQPANEADPPIVITEQLTDAGQDQPIDASEDSLLENDVPIVVDDELSAADSDERDPLMIAEKPSTPPAGAEAIVTEEQQLQLEGPVLDR
jgi:hypothetical protein